MNSLTSDFTQLIDGIVEAQKELVRPVVKPAVDSTYTQLTSHLIRVQEIPYVKPVLCATAAYGVYKSGLPRALVKGIRSLLPTWDSLRVRCGGKPQMAYEAPKGTAMGDTILESVRAGNAELRVKRPPCQVSIGYLEGGVLHVQGAGVRVLNAILVPTHVIDACIDQDLCAVGSQSTMSLDIDAFEVLDTDMSFIKLTDAELSRIGVGKASVYHDLTAEGAKVSISAPSGMGTVAQLHHDPRAFGMVVYSGTTLGGYSGAAYMKGRFCAGIHTHGGKDNGGYNMSYLYALLKHYNLMDYEEEATADFLEKAFRGKKQLTMRRGGDGGKEIILKINGRYHIVESREIEKVYGEDWDSRLTEAEEYIYQGYESVSAAGEANSSKTHPGVSNSSVKPGAQQETSSPLTTQEQLKQLLGHLNDAISAVNLGQPESSGSQKGQTAKRK